MALSTHTRTPRPRPLPPDIRSDLEASSGTDLSAVQVHEHAGPGALGAVAYTQGRDIHFVPGAYQPGTLRGKELIGHEVAHVLQQSEGRARGTARIAGLAVDRTPALEREADRFGSSAAAGGAVAFPHRRTLPVRVSSVVQLQTDPQTNAATVNYLAMIDLSEANKANLKALAMYGRERYLLSLFLGVPAEVTTTNPASDAADDITPLTLAIASWQHAYLQSAGGAGYERPAKDDFATVTGKYSDAEAALRTNGFDPTGRTQDWQAQDRADASDVLEREKAQKEAIQRDPSEGSLRQAIVDLASSQAGTVVSIDRGDGAKIGWERIARFYEVAQQDFNDPDQFKRQRDAEGVPTDGPKGDIARSKLVGIHAANRYANDKTADWSWCGIFTMWAVRSATGKGGWNGGPTDMGALHTDVHGARRGDIIYIKPSSNPNNHHIILAEDVPANAQSDYVIGAVEGNIDLQGIKVTRRWKLSDVAGYYSTVP